MRDAGGEVLSRNALPETIWPGVTVGEEVLTHAVMQIRKALGDDRRNPRYVGTVHKAGYRLLGCDDAPADPGNAGVKAAEPLLMPTFADL